MAKKSVEKTKNPPPKYKPSSNGGESKSVDKRYTVSLAKVEDAMVYQRFFETDKLEEAKKSAIAKAGVEGRECIVFDRQANWLVFNYKPEKGAK